MLPTDTGKIRIRGRTGNPDITGDGLRFITGDGRMMTRTDGYGYPVMNGLLPG